MEALAAALSFIAATTGYFVWFNWLAFAIRGRFFVVSGVSMQVLSFASHLAWILFSQANRLALANPNPAPYKVDLLTVWIIGNMVLAVGLALLFWAVDEKAAEPTDAMDSR
jgi:hypothetical protein